METRAPFIIVGAFVLAAIGAVFGFVYWLHNTAGTGVRTVHHVQFEGSVSGLLVGAAVLFNGIRVGEVTDLGLAVNSPRKVDATIAVASSTPVHADTKVGLDFQGLTGVPVIALEGGKEIGASTGPQTLIADAAAGESMTQAARNALSAGMDGVEIHAGNGYLLDQFINSSSNLRDDAYGGTIENRARLLLEVVEAVSAEIGTDKVAVRLTPMGRFMGMGDATPEDTFGYIVRRLNDLKLAYLHLVEPAMVGTVRDESADPRWDAMIKLLRAEYRGVLMLAGGYDGQSAEQALESGRADIIAFGRPFISNPDLPVRLRGNLPLAPADSSTFFGGDATGYTDYPTLS